ncbi:chloride conductance regulatory protein icln [Quercus suber]|uniref:Chloride conductance regulatory protein icln n=1 Tax=Quercus suber TaxID=58331 RepID=A0AAW0LUG9_QUESU
MVLGLREFTERVGDGAGEPVLDSDNGEELMHVQHSVAIVLGNRVPVSPGTLYISTKQVVWLSDVDKTKGYAVDFLSLSLHAVSRDPEAYPSPCIYTQYLVDTLFDIFCECAELNPEPIEGDEEEHNWIFSADQMVDEVAEEGDDFSQDPTNSIGHSNGDHDLARTVLEYLVDTLFDIFCECAELNPEPIEGDEEEHNWIFSADQMVDEVAEEGDDFSQDPTNSIGHSNGDHDLARTVLELQINDQRFEDADEMDDDHERGHH